MFNVDKILEEHDSLLWEEHKESEVDNLLDYFEPACNVKERTRKEHIDTIYETTKLVEKYRSCYSVYITIGWETLANVSLELSEVIEASIFLSIHGMYMPANALLRQWLETYIRALKHDYELIKCNKNTKNTKTYDKFLKKRDKWLEKPNYIRFRGERSILSVLIDPDTDNIATQFRKEEMSNSKKLSLYLFSWDEIPVNGNVKLTKFLNKKFSIDWVKTAKIEKINNGKTIKVFTENNFILLNLNNEKTKIKLIIDDDETDELFAKTENDKLNIYVDLSFKKEIENLFGELSKCVHFGGMTPIENLKYTFVEYNKKQFEIWYKRLNQINEICAIITLIKFPEIIALLEKRKDICLPTLGDVRNKKLEELLKSNKIIN